jgi:hypothetical protein
VQDRLASAGVEIIEARITHLAYAPESDDEFRSINAQIEFILRKALKDTDRLKKKPQESY